MSRINGRLEGGLTRAIVTVLGLAAAGLLVSDALAFGWCVPDDCAWSHKVSWTLTALAGGCVAGVVAMMLPRTSSRVRVVATVVVSIGLLVGAIVAASI